VSSEGELAPYVHAQVAAGEILAPCWCGVVAVGGVTEPDGGTAVGAAVPLLTSPCFRKGAESRRRHGLAGRHHLPIWRGWPDGTPVLSPATQVGSGQGDDGASC
jgi:hypothetical protein